MKTLIPDDRPTTTTEERASYGRQSQENISGQLSVVRSNSDKEKEEAKTFIPVAEEEIKLGAIEEEFGRYLSRSGYVNASSLKGIRKSPKHYLYELEKETKLTESMILGSAVHCLLEQDQKQWDRRFIIVKKVDGRTTYGKAVNAERQEIMKEFKAKHGYELIMINQELYDNAIKMYNSAMSKPTVAALLKDSEKETSGYWFDEEFGLPCKLRTDIKNKKRSFITDFKTATDIAQEEFAKTCAIMGYDVQVGFYLRGCSIVDKMEYEQFFFVCIENVPPFDCCVYLADEEFKQYSKHYAEICLHRLKKCLTTKDFSGVDSFSDNEQRVLDLSLPGWHLARLNNLIVQKDSNS